jgi:hypothetical protein
LDTDVRGGALDGVAQANLFACREAGETKTVKGRSVVFLRSGAFDLLTHAALDAVVGLRERKAAAALSRGGITDCRRGMVDWVMASRICAGLALGRSE